MPHTLVIIGAGFSGIATFYRLLASAQRKFNRIILVDDGKPGGVAYGLAGDSHLLNVPAGRMSGVVEDRNHFLHFVRYVLPQATAADFLPRRIYGAYLRWLLETSKRNVAADVKVACIRDRAIDISIGRGGVARIVLRSGKSFSAQKVVIATGNLQASAPKIAAPNFFASERYIADPWRENALRGLDTTRPALLIGSSLTAIDVAMTLNSRWPDLPIIMLSRHGLLPQSHRGLPHEPEMPVDVSSITSAAPRITQLLRALREQIVQHELAGGDWRDVIVALRPHTPALWQKLNRVEKKRFLRHCQSYWDTHRHRQAPQVADTLEHLQRRRLLTVEAGKIINLEEVGETCRVTLRKRGAAQSEQLDVGIVVNCAGPSTCIETSGNPLLDALQKRGLISQDEQQIGIRTAENHAVLDANGKPSGIIHYIGPWLRADFWEATAVPELREHVVQLVDSLCNETTASRRVSVDGAGYCG